MTYVYADGTQEDEGARAKRLADMLYDKLREKGMSHEESLLAMGMLYQELSGQAIEIEGTV